MTALLVRLEDLLRDPDFDYEAMVARLTDAELVALEKIWRFWGRRDQDEPVGDWRNWVMLAGRGFGKTRTGAEWVRARVAHGGAEVRLALIGATERDVRGVMIEGDSGILSVCAPDDCPIWEPTRARLIWPSGAQAYLYSAESPERLRGPQFHFAWGDEVAAWPDAAAWDNLQLALRLGERPRALATTTPRTTPFVRRLVAAPATIVTRGHTTDNRALSRHFIAAMLAEHGGTRFGRQELGGELIDDVADALWSRDLIEACRVRVLPPVRRMIVGVDPPASSGGDACGIVVVGLAVDGRAYVIEDASVRGRQPDGWAAAVAGAAQRHGADRVVAEANNGGDMVGQVLRAANAALPIRLVHASRGKVARAEPVAMLYTRGSVSHVGAFPALEDELCGLVSGGGYEGPGRSPDRADACVWALTELMLRRTAPIPRVRGL